MSNPPLLVLVAELTQELTQVYTVLCHLPCGIPVKVRNGVCIYRLAGGGWAVERHGIMDQDQAGLVRYPGPRDAIQAAGQDRTTPG